MSRSSQVDVGLSHVALLVTSVARSADFYARYARMEVVHRRRSRAGRGIVWLSDLSRPFVIVLIEADTIEGRLEGVAHLGVGCASREEVDQLCERARGEGCLDLGPEDGTAGGLLGSPARPGRSQPGAVLRPAGGARGPRDRGAQSRGSFTSSSRLTT